MGRSSTQSRSDPPRGPNPAVEKSSPEILFGLKIRASCAEIAKPQGLGSANAMPAINIPRPGGWDPVRLVYERVHVTGRYIVRPRRVEGTVGGTVDPPLPAAMYPIALYPNAPLTAMVGAIPPEDLPLGYHRGHILGRARGGPNHVCNLVPIPATINSAGGEWAQLEQDMAPAAPAHHRRYFRAELDYGNPNNFNPTIPNQVRAWAYLLPTIVPGPPGIVASRTVALNVAIAAGGALVAAGGNLIHVTNILNFATADNQPVVFSAAQNLALTAVHTAYLGWAGQPVVGGGNTGGTITGGRGDPPAGTDMGPYAFLDVLETSVVLRGLLNAAFPLLNYPGLGVIKRNRQNFAVGFTAPQRELIRLVNRWNNHGRLTSDNVWYDNNTRLDSNRAQIDHIIPVNFAPPRSSNFYWNAQVTSAEFNNAKGNQSEAVFRAAFMAMPLGGGR